MHDPQGLAQTGLALGVVFAAGLLAFPLLRTPRRVRAAALTLLAVAVFLAPLLVPRPPLRLIVSLAAILVAVKLYDLHHSADAGLSISLRTFLGYLPNDCLLVLRSAATGTSPSKRDDAARLRWLIPLTLGSLLLIAILFRADWSNIPWSVEHAAKAAAIGLLIRFGPNLGASARRLAGIPAQDFSGGFFGAATPAEFWRRWNQPAGRFLREYVYAPAGGNRRPGAALMVTFALNGLVHEYVFGIAAGRVLGWSLLFFMIQGAATAATHRLRLKGWKRAVGVALTLAFTLASSVLVFVCVNAAVPFYSRAT